MSACGIHGWSAYGRDCPLCAAMRGYPSRSERMANAYFRHKENERQIAIAQRCGEMQCAAILTAENRKLWASIDRALAKARGVAA